MGRGLGALKGSRSPVIKKLCYLIAKSATKLYRTARTIAAVLPSPLLCCCCSYLKLLLYYYRYYYCYCYCYSSSSSSLSCSKLHTTGLVHTPLPPLCYRTKSCTQQGLYTQCSESYTRRGTPCTYVYTQTAHTAFTEHV